MKLNGDHYYQAIVTRDKRFDGRFFVAVKTTGIYCRPICRVKSPQLKNCDFYPNAASAEAAGFRPCKRCRPELAPGSSLMDVSSKWARAAAFYISQDFLADRSLSELADRIGVTDRQMRRVFQEEFGVSPVQFWQTQRLLLSKQLLTDSAVPVTSVALASGFKSVRRFNALFKERYRMNPTELRKQQKAGVPDAFADFSFRLSYRPPFAWQTLLDFLARRAIPGVEAVVDQSYLRVARIERAGKVYLGHVEVSNDAGNYTLQVKISRELLPACAIVLERVKWMFDVHADPAAIAHVLGSLAAPQPGLRLPGSFDGFETAVRAILGQQVTVTAARTFAGRIVQAFGERLSWPINGLTHIFPLPARLAKLSEEDFGKLGIIRQRARSLIALAKAVAAETIRLEPGRNIENTKAQLRTISGIGAWTAEYIAMRALSWPDAFPHTDLGVMKALHTRDEKHVLKLAEKWRPWRAYAVMHLWHGEPKE